MMMVVISYFYFILTQIPFNMKNANMIPLCYSIVNEDPEVEMSQLHGLIEQKNVEIKELQNQLGYKRRDYSSLYWDLQKVNEQI